MTKVKKKRRQPNTGYTRFRVTEQKMLLLQTEQKMFFRLKITYEKVIDVY